MATQIAVPVRTFETARPGRVGLPSVRAIAVLVVLMGLGLTLGASLLFARSYVPTAAERAGSPPPPANAVVDPNC